MLPFFQFESRYIERRHNHFGLQCVVDAGTSWSLETSCSDKLIIVSLFILSFGAKKVLDKSDQNRLFFHHIDTIKSILLRKPFNDQCLDCQATKNNLTHSKDQEFFSRWWVWINVKLAVKYCCFRISVKIWSFVRIAIRV